jgi:hypothetical protein
MIKISKKVVLKEIRKILKTSLNIRVILQPENSIDIRILVRARGEIPGLRLRHLIK